jgi:2-oxoacid:acceptor oxidoreductase gamma subunit (pyruvate/2-ketoisovalerate family)
MKEIRIHGRGGQGAMAGARMLATAFVYEGKWASSFPEFGFERRGAPVRAFVRIDDRPIREKTKVYHPDCMIVIDPLLIKSGNVFEGFKPGGILVVNAPQQEAYPGSDVGIVAIVNGTKIALEELGLAITNTCMLGAFARATGWIGLEPVLLSLKEYFSGPMLEKNARCVQRGFEETVVEGVTPHREV